MKGFFGKKGFVERRILPPALPPSQVIRLPRLPADQGAA